MVVRVANQTVYRAQSEEKMKDVVIVNIEYAACCVGAYSYSVRKKRKLLDGVSFTKNQMGGVYAMVITGTDSTYETLATTVHTIAPENRVSILWQIPQYFVITVAEILFSVSGLEFAYQEASVQMKAVVQAIWLLTNAIGNIIIMAIGISAFTENLVRFTYLRF
ncbi:Peptide transporter family 1 like [Trichostrongylus colubriformis]|uniref:Peptide transporter family 1 like n=1 Tax=Trichostrongylus colubriformis TaxID=6319 RepID=A0AAN8G4J1_TRICO